MVWIIGTAAFALTTLLACAWGLGLMTDVEIISEARDGLARDLQDERNQRLSAWMMDQNSDGDVAPKQERWG